MICNIAIPVKYPERFRIASERKTDSDAPNESLRWKHERERGKWSVMKVPGDSRPESIFLSISVSDVYSSFHKRHKALPLTDVITFAAETSTIDYWRASIMRSRPTSSYGEFKHADMHLSRALRRASSLRCTCHMSLLVIMVIIINFINGTTRCRSAI